MCVDPATALAGASFVANAAGSVAQYVGQLRMADDQEDAINRNAGQQFNAGETRRVQIQAQSSEDRVNALINAVAEQGRISASSSSLGSDAATAQRFSNASDFKAGRGAAIQELNTQNQLQQIQADREATELQRRNQIGNIQRPTALSLGLALAGDAIGAATTRQNLAGS